MIYICKVCGYEYDESKEATSFADLPDSWVCPVCGVGKDMFEAGDEPNAQQESDTQESENLSEVLAQTLSNWGVKYVFGMVGHSNLGTADAIRKQVQKGDMEFIGIRHEGAGSFASSAYGKLMGKPSAVLTIAGPGATNLLTGVYDAKLDSAPLIALTGQIPAKELGWKAFQEIDLEKPFADAVSDQYTLSATSRVGDMASSACRNAILKKSPVQIILPDDIQTAPSSQKATTPQGVIFSAKPSPAFAEMEKASEILKSSKLPIIIVGAGCVNAMNEVLAFAETLDIPIATTYRAKGFLPDSHALACGVIGRSGTSVANKLASDSDLIIGLGCSFSKHSEIPKNKKIIQIDINPLALGRLRRIDCGLTGDIAETLPMLCSIAKQKVSFLSRKAEISALWAEWREEKTKRANASTGAITPALACQALTKSVPQNAIVSVDVGNVAYSVGRYFESANQRFLLSFYLGSIGVGLPSAIGAWCASQEENSPVKNRPVVAIVGDGGLGQYLTEWTTVAKYNMDIKCVVFNNSELAKISLEQRNAHYDVWETSLVNPSFADFAKLCGTNAVRLTNPDTLEQDLQNAISQKGACLIEIDIKD